MDKRRLLARIGRFTNRPYKSNVISGNLTLFGRQRSGLSNAAICALSLLAALLMVTPGVAQSGPATPDTPPIAEPACRPGVPGVIRPRTICAETILDNLPSQGIASISGITFSPDGTLYFARPATSQIMRMRPDGSGFFQAPEVFVDGLPEPPNGLTYDPVDSAWYVSMDTTILRLRMVNGALDRQTLVSNLPGGSGGWLGDIRIGPDRRLYVAKASSCDACIETDERRGALLSFALDGGDPKTVARGLRDSYQFDWVNGTLYIVDDEPVSQLGELNALTPEQLRGGTVDFGWPRCDAKGKPVAGIEGASAAACAQTVKPILTFDAGSHPSGLVYYSGGGPHPMAAGLYIALAGSWNANTITGYELWLVIPDGKTVHSTRVLPLSFERNAANDAVTGISFYPWHMTALAVDPNGWLYATIAEGRIYRFRAEPVASVSKP